MNEKEYNILKECESFIRDRASLQAKEVMGQEQALRRMTHFWDDDNKREWKRTRRKNLSFSKFNTWTDAIASPFIKSPFHIELQPRVDEIQDKINQFEHAFGTKMAYRQGIKRGTACGAGFVAIGLENNMPCVELVQNQGSIVWDDTDFTPSLQNMKKCAIVKFIDEFTASNEFGWDHSSDCLNLSGITRWGEEKNRVPKVMYYKIVSGRCVIYVICGRTVKAYPLNCSRIPIARFAGWQSYGSNGITYEGIVQRLYDLALAENIGFSQLVERSARSLKPKLAMSQEAMKGLAAPLGKVESDESLIIPYNMAGGAPTILQEHFQTDDLTTLISNTRNLQQDTLGIPLTGLQTYDKTATEIMLQQNNSESNVEEVYMNAEMAVRHISTCIIEMIAGQPMDFQLENGPAVVTTAAKERQELGVVASMVPEAMKPLIASRIADTLQNDEGKRLAADIRANYGELRTSVTDSGTVVNELAQTKNLLNEAVAAGDEQSQTIRQLQQTIEQLQKQILEMELAAINDGDAKALQMEKMAIDNENKKIDQEIKMTELEIKKQALDEKAVTDAEKNQIAAEKNIIEALK